MDDRYDHQPPADSYERALDAAADTLADKIVDALVSPMIWAVMRADRVHPSALRSLLRQMKARLGMGCPQGCA